MCLSLYVYLNLLRAHILGPSHPYTATAFFVLSSPQLGVLGKLQYRVCISLNRGVDSSLLMGVKYSEGLIVDMRFRGEVDTEVRGQD